MAGLPLGVSRTPSLWQRQLTNARPRTSEQRQRGPASHGTQRTVYGTKKIYPKIKCTEIKNDIAINNKKYTNTHSLHMRTINR